MNVTLWPNVDGLTDELTAVVVPAFAIVMSKVWVASGDTVLLALTVMFEKVPAAVGVPESVPLAARVRPSGRVPLCLVNTTEEDPFAEPEAVKLCV